RTFGRPASCPRSNWRGWPSAAKKKSPLSIWPFLVRRGCRCGWLTADRSDCRPHNEGEEHHDREYRQTSARTSCTRRAHLPLVPNERIRHTDKFDDPNLAGQMQTTISLRTVSVGTELTVVQEGIPSVIPVEACYLGWQESLMLLTQLVEAEITG